MSESIVSPNVPSCSIESTLSNRNCCVPGCTTYGYPIIPGHGKISYHNFPPAGDPLRKQWIINIKRDESDLFKVTSSTVVCSLHFTKENLEYHPFSGRRTKLPGCVPTVFNCWKHLNHIYKEQRSRPLNALQKAKNVTKVANTKCSKLHDTGETCPEAVDEGSVSEVPVENIFNDASVCANEHELDNFFLSDEIKKLKEKNEKMLKEFEKLKLKNLTLKSNINLLKFAIENLNDKDVNFYTGFSSRAVFNEVLNFLNPGPNGENMILNTANIDNIDEIQCNVKSGRPRKLSPENQFLMFLCRVKVGLFEYDLSNRFGVSISTVSNVLISWANFCYQRLGTLNIWPSKKQVFQYMPQSFKEKYPSTRVIIDCTEIKVEMSSSLLLKSQTYSNYKSANTLKGLIGISPSGSVSFVSQLFTGCISDREITERSGFLQLPFDKGDSIMADKGFNIQDLLDEVHVKLNIPPFLGMYDQMTGGDVLRTQSIAAERIHVERAINKIKSFHIFDQVIPLSLMGSINQIWTVCALLTLFQEPIISVS